MLLVNSIASAPAGRPSISTNILGRA